MRKNTSRLTGMVLAGVLGTAFAVLAQTESDVDLRRREFADPPCAARPWTRWFWMNGNVTTNGITHDLEAMKALGLGGAIIMDQTWFDVPQGCVAPNSEGWFDFAVFAGQEADRLGLKLGFHNCPGWSSTGGPWVEPKDAQKVLRWTETRVSGGRRVTCKVPRPAAPFGWFRDVATLAVPVREGEDWFEAKRAADEQIRFDFPEPRTVACVLLEVKPWRWDLPGYAMPLGLQAPRTRFAVSVSEDGREFREIAEVPMTDEAPDHTVSFPPVRAKAVRIVPLDDASAPRRWTRVRFSSVPRIPHANRKSLRYYFRKCGVAPLVPENSMSCPPELAIRPADVIDLGDRVDADGNLDWEAPAGEWTILRFAAVVQDDARNHPAGRGAEGLECDKLSRPGVEAGVSGTVRRMSERVKRAGVKAYEFAYVDSYEVPAQNWTEAFPEEFQKRRGYDLVRELPVLTGRFVESTAHSEKVLDDFRRTFADLFATYYNDAFAELVHGYGFRLMSQPYPGPFDQLRQARSSDVPAVEFWFRFPLNMCRLAGSIGNVLGKRIVAAESFTEAPPAAADLHNEAVADLKRRGDLMYSLGVNLFELHGTVQQPSDDPSKRMFFGRRGNQFGCSFDRHHPDYATFRPWVAYLGRAQYLLQQGRGVADILYVQRGRSPEQPSWEPEPPYGWKGDCIDPETFAEKGKMGYRIVVRPGTTPEELRRLIARHCPQPDFAATENGRSVRAEDVVFAHRTCDWAEVYFVANQTDRPLSLDCRFRATGACEEWDAWTGTSRGRGDVRVMADGISACTLDLPAGASRFVVFSKTENSSRADVPPYVGTREAYVPTPEPPTGDYYVACHYYPGWPVKSGNYSPFADARDFPERTPLLGYYDESDPEVYDWQVKWAREHGINCFIFCWYRHRENVGHPLTDPKRDLRYGHVFEAMERSRYGKMMDFAIMWECDNAGGAADVGDLTDNLVDFWARTYFSKPNYLKDGKRPVVFVYDFSLGQIRAFGGPEKFRAALAAASEKAKAYGYDGIHFAVENRHADPKKLEMLRAAGYEQSFAYCWQTLSPVFPKEEDCLENQLKAMRSCVAWDPKFAILTCSVGWDPYPWERTRPDGPRWWCSRWKLSPGNWRRLLGEVKAMADALPADAWGRRFIMLDNWNEWCEGHYICPHALGGFKYVQAVREVFTNRDNLPDYRTPAQLGLGPYDKGIDWSAPRRKPLEN